MIITVVISIYKDVEALELILESLSTQTYKNFDVLVSEDCQSQEVANFLQNYQTDLQIKHISQEDKGWRKNIALNNALRNANGEYLIFLDGDIVPYSNFVEMHLKHIEPNRFLSGRRTELGPFFSKLIRKKKLSYRTIERLYIPLLPFLLLDKARHAEEGVFLKPGSYLERKINKKKKKNMMLVGCNFSCFKADLERINGFDEDYDSPSVGEDVDLAWRLNHFGVTSKSIRYMANSMHLYHTRNWGNALKENDIKMQTKIKNEEYICLNGLKKFTKDVLR
ncbi:MAG: glycosyltransferase [Campylobacterales bacterium]|nr:glycosyltransferase [Campylobacterales bacterium]